MQHFRNSFSPLIVSWLSRGGEGRMDRGTWSRQLATDFIGLLILQSFMTSSLVVSWSFQLVVCLSKLFYCFVVWAVRDQLSLPRQFALCFAVGRVLL